MTTTRSAADDARDLPPEPTAPWILVLAGGVVLLWLGVLAWQVAVLPERVPTHFGADGRADGWSSRTGALAFSALIPLLVVLPMPLLSRLALWAPGQINAPNKEWWTATGPRLRRFERLMREDLWLITTVTLLLLVAGQVGIVLAARSGGDAMPTWILPVALVVFLVAIGAVMARMFIGGRYAAQPDLD